MALYLDYFGLSSPPFRLTSHPDFFFRGASRGAILDALLYAVCSGEGLIKVSAEVGAGKTMLCRMLLEQLPPQIDAIFLPNPLLSEDELLLTLADELQLNLTAERASQKIRALEEALIMRFAQGRQVVVLIDEAHAMPNSTLELIRLLSNLDSGHHKLLQIVLFGQLELDEKLLQPELRALRERISYSLVLPPLSSTDVSDYLACRLFAAGHQGNALFSAAAARHIAQLAQGLSRRVNLLADKSLLAAFAENAPQVSIKHARRAARECEYTSVRTSQRLFVAAVVMVVLLIAFAAWCYLPPASMPSAKFEAAAIVPSR